MDRQLNNSLKASYDSAPISLLPPAEAFARINSDSAGMQRQDSNSATAAEVFFGLCCGGYGLLLDAQIDKELIELKEVCTLPNTPEWLYGFINLRSQVVPVFDLSQNRHAKRHTQQGYALIISIEGVQHGMLLDELPVKLHFDAQQQLSSDVPAFPLLSPHLSRCFHDEKNTDQPVWWEWQAEGLFRSLCKKLEGQFYNSS